MFSNKTLLGREFHSLFSNNGRTTLSFGKSADDQATISITPKENGYLLHIIDESVRFINSATGTVVIDDNGVVVVNDTVDGRLRDRYNDGFDLKPDAYLHCLQAFIFAQKVAQDYVEFLGNVPQRQNDLQDHILTAFWEANNIDHLHSLLTSKHMELKEDVVGSVFLLLFLTRHSTD